MMLWSAFLMGFLGSLHCAGMCGPLVLAIPRTGTTTLSQSAGRAAYNLGRICTYSLLGAVFGLLGMSFALAGIQRWVSVVAGILVITVSLGWTLKGVSILPFGKFYSLLRNGLGHLIRKKSLPCVFLLGSLNGLLPCGLVYMACAVAISTGDFLGSIQYMALFGLGTVPMMVGISLMGGFFPNTLRTKLQRATPYCLACVGVLLVLRGMSLGIPYISPAWANGHLHCPACH